MLYKIMSDDAIRKITALNDGDVLLERKRAAAVDGKKLDSIFNRFSNLLNGMIKRLIEGTDKTDPGSLDELGQLESLRRIIGMVPVDEKFFRCKDKIYAAHTRILEGNVDWFVHQEYDHIVKDDSNKDMIMTLIRMIKHRRATIPEKEIQDFRQIGLDMLKCVVEYNLLVNPGTTYIQPKRKS